MKQIPLDKLQASTLAERQHGVIVVRERPDGSYGVIIGKRCLAILRDLERSGRRGSGRGISATFLLAWQGPRIRTLDLVRGDLRSPLRRNRGRAMA